MSRKAKALHHIRDWVEDRLGIVFRGEQENILYARVSSLCQQQKVTETGTWAALTRGDLPTETRVAETASTNHTAFFREPEAFDALRYEILPTLPEQDYLRVWSAAASSGEEAYTVAITLHRALGQEGFRRVRILGTDISERQIQHAEQAIYQPRRILGVGKDAGHYFHRTSNDEYRVISELTRQCIFRRMNLARFPWPFQQAFHVIFLRNVLYYFDNALSEQILEACYENTTPGGWLITSTTEPMLGLKFRWTPIRPGIYRKEP